MLGWLAAFSEAIAEAFPLLKRAVREGVGADTMHAFLRNSGLEVARSEVREVMGRLSLENSVKDYISQLTESAKPLRAFIPETSTRITKEYRYTLEATGEDTETGEQLVRTLSLTTDSILSKSEAQERMLEGLGGRFYSESAVPTGATVTFIERRAG